MLSVYDSLQSETNKSSERLAPLGAARYKDYSIQAVYDVLVSETLLKRFTDLPTVAYADVSADWKERLDPVDEALLAPLMAEAAREYIARSKFLLPGSSMTVTLGGASGGEDGGAAAPAASDGVFGAPAPRLNLLPLALNTTTARGLRPTAATSKDEKIQGKVAV